MNSSRPTLLTPVSLRNELIGQEFKLEKANCSHLTMKHAVILTPLAMLAFVAMSMQAFSQNDTTHPCMSASAITIQQILQAPCEQELENASIESILDSIAGAYQISIWCDRRIARDTTVHLDRRSETLEQFLTRAIEKVDAVLVPLAGVVMVVPKSKQDEIEAAHWRLSISPAAKKMRPLGAKPFGWQDGSIAINVIRDFSSRCAPDASLIFKTEHDIWRGFEFRKTTSAASISMCLLSGFDLCLADQNGDLAVASIPLADSNVARTYTKEEVETKIGQRAWKEWRTRWPNASITKSEKPAGWRVTGTVASHRDLIRPLIPQKKWESPKLNQKGFTGTMDGDMEHVIRSLAAQTGLEFFPLPLPASLESKTIKLKLVNTPLDDILKEIAKQSGVQFKRQGNRVEIIP